eukprot:2622206-Rhodomonas_salina.1
MSSFEFPVQFWTRSWRRTYAFSCTLKTNEFIPSSWPCILTLNSRLGNPADLTDWRTANLKQHFQFLPGIPGHRDGTRVLGYSSTGSTARRAGLHLWLKQCISTHLSASSVTP